LNEFFQTSIFSIIIYTFRYPTSNGIIHMKIFLFHIFLLLFCSQLAAQKYKIPDLQKIPHQDSVICMQYESNQINLYLLTPVAKELQKKYPESYSIVRCNRRLAQMRIDLSGFNDKKVDTLQFKTDSTISIFHLYQYHDTGDTSRYLYYMSISKKTDTVMSFCLKTNDHTWIYSTYLNGNMRLISSDSLINMKLINIKPQHRDFKTDRGKRLYINLGTTSAKNKFLVKFSNLLKPKDPDLEE